MGFAAHHAAQRYHRPPPAAGLPARRPPVQPPELLFVTPAGGALQPNVVEASGHLRATGRLTARAQVVTIEPAVETDVAMPLDVVKSPVDARTGERAAGSDDIAVVSFPFAVSMGVFTILTAFADKETGAVWGVAAFAITVIAMRNEYWDEFIARLSELLRPPRD